MPDEVLGPRSTRAGKHQPAHERTSYNIADTPQSPTQTMSSTSQSVSNDASTSSCSPPEPVTPPKQSRSRTRYPELGRVPLHRRGNSKTYERLEDLLKEAGYKETRVFTPEAERMQKGTEEEEDGSKDLRLAMKEGVGAVVGFLAGLIPNTAGNKPESNIHISTGPSPPLGLSPPPSPLAEAHARRSQVQTPTTANTALSSSLESLGNPTVRNARQQQPSWESNAMLPPPIPSSSSKTPSGYRPTSQWSSSQYSLATTIQKQASRNSLHRANQQNQRPDSFAAAPTLHIASPRPSRAGALLRHISSVPSMPARPNSTPIDPSKANKARKICLNDSDSEHHHHHHHHQTSSRAHSSSRRRTAYVNNQEEPPLPATWLESVARAVLFGGTGAHIGGPAEATATVGHAPISSTTTMGVRTSAGKTPALRTTRSSLSQTSRYGAGRSRSYHRLVRSGLSDQTNTAGTSNGNGSNNALLVPPPMLFTMLERGRAGKSEGEVSTMRVMCRSAPGSRAGSLVRGSSDDAKEKQRRQGRKRAKKEDKDKDRMPCLAQTRAEGDVVWERGRSPAQRPQGTAARHNNPTSWGMYADSDDEGAGGPSSSSSDEGEIDLARILVPPKRQNSIRSLRKHLHHDPQGHRSSHAHSTLLNLVPGTTGVRSGNLGIQRPTSAFQRRMTEDHHDGEWDGEHHDEFGSGWVKRGLATNRVEDDDDDGSFIGFLREDKGGGWTGSGRSRRGEGHGRLGLTNAWGLLPGGSGS